MSVTAILSYSLIYSWLLNSCMPHFPTFFFFLAFSQILGSCQIAYLQLLFSNDCCFFFTLTHSLSLSLSYTCLAGGEEGGWLQDFQFCSPCPHFDQKCCGEFYFQFSNSIVGMLRGKKPPTITCTYPLPPTSFPHVIHLLVREGFPMRCCWYPQGSGGRVSPLCHDSCHSRGFTLAVLHIEGLSKHVLRLHSTIYAKMFIYPLG